MTILTVDGRRVRVTSPERVLWPATGTTKLDLLDYVLDVAPALLAHLMRRPVALRRFPEGVEGYGWYQVRARQTPEWLPTTQAPGDDGPVDLVLVEDRAALVWAAQQAAVELHAYPFRAGDPDRAAELVFDLDPGPPADLTQCARVALELRDALGATGLEGWPKASGGLGLHVVVPLEPPEPFGRTKRLARAYAAILREELPELVVTDQARARRTGKVFVDWLQNDRWRSLVAPYSLRAGTVPTVAAPVSWDEVEQAASGRLTALVFTPEDMRARLDRLGDVMAGALERPQRLPALA